jgi:hypothetical protein
MSEADILRADDRRFEAMLRADWAALDAALAEDLTYVHSTARLESKAEHLANLRAGRPRYRGIAPRERRARMHGNIGVAGRPDRDRCIIRALPHALEHDIVQPDGERTAIAHVGVAHIVVVLRDQAIRDCAFGARAPRPAERDRRVRRPTRRA